MNQHNITPSNSNQEQGEGTSNFSLDELKNDTNQQLVRATNKFPVDAFPEPIRYIIESTCESLNFHVDFIGASILYAASVSIGNSYEIEVKRGFRQSAVLYIAIVARPGVGKTPPLKFALKPLVEHDANTYRQYDVAKKIYDIALKTASKDKKEIEGDKPVWKKILLTDYTPEALAEVHRFNKRGIGVYADELAGWFKNFGRYSKGSEMEFWLQQWSGNAINIDLKTSDPIHIESPFISVGGTIQNGVLNELAKESRTQNGFLDRILFSFPDNVSKQYYSEDELSPTVIESWHNIVNNLLELHPDEDNNFNPVRKVLRLSLEAKEVWLVWHKENTDQCNNAESDELAGMISKMDMHVSRIALILELLRYACNESNLTEISIESFRGAMQLIEYFKRSAMKVHSILSDFNPVTKLSKTKQELYNTLPEVFLTADSLRIGKELGMPERNVKRFLTDSTYFYRIGHGQYGKIIY